MELKKYNTLDNIVITLMILIAGFGGLSPLSIAMSFPLGIIYFVFRNQIINLYNNKKGIKDESKEIDDMNSIEEINDEFDFDDEEDSKKKKK